MANSLFQCPYDRRVACDMRNGCCGCEEFARHLRCSAPSATTNTGSLQLLLEKFSAQTQLENIEKQLLSVFVEWVQQHG
jgi:hypothetical protein